MTAQPGGEGGGADVEDRSLARTTAYATLPINPGVEGAWAGGGHTKRSSARGRAVA